MRVVGVTGTIGSGKSAVLGLLAARGARTVDADALVHRLYDTDPDLQRLLSERFGPHVVVTGRVDRAALRRALSTPQALADLEAIVHPAVQRARDDLIAEAARQGQAVFALEAIKLVESGAADRCDELWIVVVPPAVQLARLAARGLDEAEVRRRLAWQGDVASWTDAFLEQSVRLGRPRPVLILDNGGTPAQTESQLDRLWEGLTERSALT
jgi:dephospho-CoA kinase